MGTVLRGEEHMLTAHCPAQELIRHFIGQQPFAGQQPLIGAAPVQVAQAIGLRHATLVQATQRTEQRVETTQQVGEHWQMFRGKPFQPLPPGLQRLRQLHG